MKTILCFSFVFFVGLSPWTVLLIAKVMPGKVVQPQIRLKAGESMFRLCDYAFLVGAAFLGAWLFNALKIPNGIMMGAMLACGLLAVCIKKTYKFEIKARYITQIALGATLGQSITPDIVGELQKLLIPGLVSSIVATVGAILIALILYKTASMDIVTCVLCTSPAGVSQAAFLADEMGADSLTTSIFQTCRLLSIIAFYPLIVTSLT